MVYSMTGFGRAEGIIGNKKITIQIRSLNSKLTDVTIKLPSLFREEELNFRKKIAAELGRGKIEMNLFFQAEEASNSHEINQEVFKNYYNQIKELQLNIDSNENNIVAAILKLPEVIQTKEDKIEEEDKKALNKLLEVAIKDINAFRKDEGEVLHKDLLGNIKAIEDFLEQALKFEKERTETVRNRLLSNLEESQQKGKIDTDRFEQEMIYYMEKYDISEEKVRLKAHCDYFLQTMNDGESQGKKLGFISQEIGREINTLGSKANHAEMQKLVVQMKDHLEKIKEQVLNVL